MLIIITYQLAWPQLATKTEVFRLASFSRIPTFSHNPLSHTTLNHRHNTQLEAGTMNFSAGYINDINSRAVLINSRAVLLLQQNRHKDAIGWLRRGLSNLASIEQQQVTYDAQQQNVLTHHASPKCVDAMDAEDEERSAYSVEIPEVRDTIISVSPDNVFVVFNRAFHLSDDGVKTAADSAKASATLLYNMGLAWHHLGAQENNTDALKKALFAYERAYSALFRQCNDSFSCLVMLALCNNMAHIHSHFFNLEEAKRCRDLIPHILACSSAGNSSMAADDYAFFLSEAMLLEGQDLKFAPAA
jgi:tetratricopeptide (TPR) repeat protein